MKSFFYPTLYCRLFGFVPWDEPSPVKTAISNAFFLILYGLYLAGTYASLAIEARTIDIFARNSFFCGSCTLDVAAYTVLLFNKQKITDVLRDMEEFLQESKYT